MKGFLSGIGIRLAIVAAIAIGGFILRDRLTGSPGDLQVGDCFDEPAAAFDISEVQRHPCADAHTAEVFFVGPMPGVDGATYPTDTDLLAFASSACAPAFDTYTGTAIETNPTLDFSMFYPTEDGWADGDRDVLCYLVRIDGGPMTGSLRATSP